MSQFTDTIVLITGDLPAQHVQCILCEEALTGNKRFLIVLHKNQSNITEQHTLYHTNIHGYMKSMHGWYIHRYSKCYWSQQISVTFALSKNRKLKPLIFRKPVNQKKYFVIVNLLYPCKLDWLKYKSHLPIISYVHRTC